MKNITTIIFPTGETYYLDFSFDSIFGLMYLFIDHVCLFWICSTLAVVVCVVKCQYIFSYISYEYYVSAVQFYCGPQPVDEYLPDRTYKVKNVDLYKILPPRIKNYCHYMQSLRDFAPKKFDNLIKLIRLELVKRKKSKYLTLHMAKLLLLNQLYPDHFLECQLKDVLNRQNRWISKMVPIHGMKHAQIAKKWKSVVEMPGCANALMPSENIDQKYGALGNKLLNFFIVIWAVKETLKPKNKLISCKNLEQAYFDINGHGTTKSGGLGLDRYATFKSNIKNSAKFKNSEIRAIVMVLLAIFTEHDRSNLKCDFKYHNFKLLVLNCATHLLLASLLRKIAKKKYLNPEQSADVVDVINAMLNFCNAGMPGDGTTPQIKVYGPHLKYEGYLRLMELLKVDVEILGLIAPLRQLLLDHIEILTACNMGNCIILDVPVTPAEPSAMNVSITSKLDFKKGLENKTSDEIIETLKILNELKIYYEIYLCGKSDLINMTISIFEILNLIYIFAGFDETPQAFMTYLAWVSRPYHPIFRAERFKKICKKHKDLVINDLMIAKWDIFAGHICE